ncbi:hypothetical protein BU14_1196s0002 [Porphyra umbilicalis]|uniref:Uncharacterized protein n=1 Tax=Porphyra umbilicalis TaxID=2786 RepID=A0A1X6NMA5_PORUM|nr:hypothetical protein BU14_1196s0002 [Porphyra umbilicalis]|eukprot:OSX69754.1 hypothetical protein BU14_1196s0002 [Porphyra umbilicalis]
MGCRGRCSPGGRRRRDRLRVPRVEGGASTTQVASEAAAAAAATGPAGATGMGGAAAATGGAAPRAPTRARCRAATASSSRTAPARRRRRTAPARAPPRTLPWRRAATADHRWASPMGRGVRRPPAALASTRCWRRLSWGCGGVQGGTCRPTDPRASTSRRRRHRCGWTPATSLMRCGGGWRGSKALAE